VSGSGVDTGPTWAGSRRGGCALGRVECVRWERSHRPVQSGFRSRTRVEPNWRRRRLTCSRSSASPVRPNKPRARSPAVALTGSTRGCHRHTCGIPRRVACVPLLDAEAACVGTGPATAGTNASQQSADLAIQGRRPPILSPRDLSRTRARVDEGPDAYRPFLLSQECTPCTARPTSTAGLLRDDHASRSRPMSRADLAQVDPLATRPSFRSPSGPRRAQCICLATAQDSSLGAGGSMQAMPDTHWCMLRGCITQGHGLDALSSVR